MAEKVTSVVDVIMQSNGLYNNVIKKSYQAVNKSKARLNANIKPPTHYIRTDIAIL